MFYHNIGPINMHMCARFHEGLQDTKETKCYGREGRTETNRPCSRTDTYVTINKDNWTHKYLKMRFIP